MIRLKDLIYEEQSKKMIVYHGSDKLFKKFNLKNATQGIVWFSSNKQKVLNKEVGASGHGYVYTCEVTINKPAGWKEYDKYLLDQLTSMGYDGVILPNSYGFDGFVFSPEQIKIIKTEKVGTDLKESIETNTIQMYHGGTKWSRIPTELRSGAKGRYEGGVGIYFTNSYETARSYARGSKVVHLVEIDKNYRDIKNIKVPLDDVVNFIKNVRGMKRKKEVIDSLTNLSNRLNSDLIPLDSLNNLIVNFEAGAGSPGVEISNYFVRKGADASLQHQRGDEYWLVVFNPNIIKKVEVVNPKLIKQGFKFMLPLAEVDYRGSHEAPDKTNGAPLHDLTNIYPDDIYGPNGPRYYGDMGGDLNDITSINLMRLAKGKPNMMVKIYRAIPSIITDKDKIKLYTDQKKFILKYGKIPPGVNTNLGRSDYYDYISNELEKLEREPDEAVEKAVINPGDWVTLNKRYAIHHGRSSLRGKYKVLSKMVPAKHLYTDGGSVHEFGYDPS